MSANHELGSAKIVEHSVSYSSLPGKQVNRLLQFSALSPVMQVDIEGAVGAGGKGLRRCQEEVALCTCAGVMLKGGDGGQVEGNQHLLCTVLCPFCPSQSVLLAARLCSLLMPTLRVRTLRLREVNALAPNHTAKKLIPAEVHLFPELPW